MIAALLAFFLSLSVIDGDTIVVDGKHLSIANIDAPGIQYFSSEQPVDARQPDDQKRKQAEAQADPAAACDWWIGAI
ncbi:MAG: hypothetical protein WBA44_01540 [Mesorhizobium sp.]